MNQLRHPTLRSTSLWIRALTVASSAAALAAPLAFAGCTNATGTISGGEYILPTIDAGVVETGVVETIPDLALPPNCSDGGANGGSRWQDLYACYFGPPGVASCSRTAGSCHGDTMSAGYSGSAYLTANGQGFECPGDPTTCWTTLTAVLIQDAGADPPSTNLLQVLRQSSSGVCGLPSCMPLAPADLVFGPDDVARITAWIASGSPNN